ncbi:hypothetical protein [uncultured Sphaerochaeta sp.]|uniref:hypothetical protein n=1 Tax=uncultured Sphaerochaeta sp. TaxID=886478 RepID=UPI00260CC6A6|nr:hypothetical protein [uncultured Sphaerochaeta sp.]
MATLDFELCFREEFAKADFTDTTGRQPTANPDGYGQYTSIKGYTGTLTFCDCDGAEAASKTVTPAASGISEEITFSSILPDGWYEVTYKVLDESLNEVGRQTHFLLVDGAFKCLAISKSADAARTADRKKQNDILKNVYLAEMLAKNSNDLANAGLIEKACTVFTTAQNILNNC